MHDDPPGLRTASSVADEVLGAASDELRRRARLRTGVSRESFGRGTEVVATMQAPERGPGPRIDLGDFDARAYDLPAINFLAEPRIALAVTGRIASRFRETAIDRTGATYRVEEKSRPGSLLLNGPLNLRPDGSFSFTVLPEIPPADRSRSGFLYAITVTGRDMEGREASTTLHLYAPNPIVHRPAPFPDLQPNGRDTLLADDPRFPDRDSRLSACEIKGLHLVIRELKDDKTDPVSFELS